MKYIVEINQFDENDNKLYKKAKDHFEIALYSSLGLLRGDYHIAGKLRMSTTGFRNYMMTNYNANVIYDKTLFKEREDAERAVEWIEAVLLANSLG